VSAISQNRPAIIEIKGLKTSHFKEKKTAPRDRDGNGSMGHVERPQSEPANNDIQLGPARMVAATNCEGVGDQSGNGQSVFTAAKTNSLVHRRAVSAHLMAERRLPFSYCESRWVRHKSLAPLPIFARQLLKKHGRKTAKTNIPFHTQNQRTTDGYR
jgi:hypothetical protein